MMCLNSIYEQAVERHRRASRSGGLLHSPSRIVFFTTLRPYSCLLATIITPKASLLIRRQRNISWSLVYQAKCLTP